MNTLTGINSQYSISSDLMNNKVKTEELKERLQNSSATDTELMDACKGFETYMVEQVIKQMQKTVPKTEDKNTYLEYFGDMLNNEYAETVTEKQGLGIAQMLYDAMKRNS